MSIHMHIFTRKHNYLSTKLLWVWARALTTQNLSATFSLCMHICVRVRVCVGVCLYSTKNNLHKIKRLCNRRLLATSRSLLIKKV